MKDFLISYNKADRNWAEWIAWQLEEAGYTTVVQSWDSGPGRNLVVWMQQAALQAQRTIAVLSQAYLNASFTQPEWATTFRQDPSGEKGTLLPVRVQECDPKGLFAAIIYIDLVDKEEAAAREALLKGVNLERVKPSSRPGFHVATIPEFPALLSKPASKEKKSALKKIGKYEILEEIGRGGMGVVYRARDPFIERDVAIKLTTEGALEIPEVKERFFREARTAGKLSHENIMTIYDFGQEDGIPYIVMEYLTGSDLQSKIDERCLLRLSEKIDYAKQICKGLQYAHSHRIVHRAIKPRNIRILENGKVKIRDFGIAKPEQSDLTDPGTIIGTPSHMSPEQIKGEKVDIRSDIFSFGILFYELLTYKKPFTGESTTVLYKIIHEEPEKIELPEKESELKRILSKCLRKKPEDRYSDCSQITKDLEKVLVTQISAQDYERIARSHKGRAESEFELNLTQKITLQQLEIGKLAFFTDLKWQFQPQINVLLGRNGYGKTQLIRALIALLQKDVKADEFFESSKRKAFMQLLLLRDEKDEVVRRTEEIFEKSIGKVPVLAIPDARFLNKSTTKLSLLDDDKSDLKSDGAYHVLHQKPYDAIIQNFLIQCCLFYFDNGKSFELPIFNLIKNVIQDLTDNSFAFHKVEELGNSRFNMQVITEGNEKNPLPIQKASQGTLSVLAIFGLIYDYLRRVFPKTDSNDLLEKPAIVFIDEIDAHLHPTWQQKIVRLLRKNFPNVQFVLTAHSPLIVAGCFEGEVSVLRKNKQNRFTVFQFVNDFIGWQLDEIYNKVFEVEEKDESYRYFSALYPFKEKIESQIKDLEKKPKRTQKDEKKLQELYDELNYLQKAQAKQDERLGYDQLVRENRRIKKQLEQMQAEG